MTNRLKYGYNGAGFTVYMFGDDDRFISRTTHTYSEGTPDGAGRKFTVSTTGSGERRFVFVKAPAGYSLPNPSVGSSITDMESIVTPAYTGTPPLTAPFVMSNALASDQPYVKVTDIGTQSTDITVSLKRRVARFDVVADGIDITNVSISNAAPTGRVLDHADNVLAPGVGGLTYTIAGSALANTGTSFYLYPTTLGAGSTGTVITVMAESKTYSIPLASDQPIDANKLYRIMVTQSVTGSDLSFKLVVADWTDTDNLPTFEEGSVEAGFNPVVSSSDGVSTSTSSDGYSIVDYSEATGAASAQLYYVSASNAKPTLGEIEALHGTHSEAIDVSISNPVQVSYAGTAGYMSTVTISLPSTTVPVDLKVRLTGTTGDKDSVSIISVPAYYDERYLTNEPYKPVLIGGRYWAPVNVGATELGVATTVPTTLAQGGYYFQWGRNTPLAPETDENSPGTLLTILPVAPVTPEDAENDATYTNKLIGASNSTLTGDWTTRNDNLWSGDGAQGPCPDGWRVPTLTESLAFTTPAFKMAYIDVDNDKRFRFKGTNPDEYLYVAPRGFYNQTRFSGDGVGGEYSGTMWAASTSGANSEFIFVQYTINTGNTGNVSRSLALPVRCVQQ